MFYFEKSRIRTRANMKVNIVSSLLCRARLERQASEDIFVFIHVTWPRGGEEWSKLWSVAEVLCTGTSPKQRNKTILKVNPAEALDYCQKNIFLLVSGVYILTHRKYWFCFSASWKARRGRGRGRTLHTCRAGPWWLPPPEASPSGTTTTTETALALAEVAGEEQMHVRSFLFKGW